MKKGQIIIIGTGPGSKEYISPRAIEALQESELIVGYGLYIDLVSEFIVGKDVFSSGMMKERERCVYAVEQAKNGKRVCVVSSGDAGIYGMAGLVIEVIDAQQLSIFCEVVPGISASNAAASRLGAPLMNDFATISLSDLLTPWDVIVTRVEAAAAGDFVICLYNPRSKKRVAHLQQAVEIMSRYKPGNTPVGIVRNAMREDEEVVHTTLDQLLNQQVDMLSIVIIGNSQTELLSGYMVTRRGYGVGN